MSKQTDLYFDNKHIVDRLIEEYNNGEPIHIAFDFDDTVFGYRDVDDTHDKVVNIIKWAQDLRFPTILYTVREEKYLDEAISHLETLGITPTYINENPNWKSRKPFFNVLLDDRGGLRQSYECLHQFLTYIEKHYGENRRKSESVIK